MKIFSSPDELYKSLDLTPGDKSLSSQTARTQIADLTATFVFSKDLVLKSVAEKLIRNTAQDLGIYPASIYSLYNKIGSGEVDADFTVPALNIRALTFDTAALVFKLMQVHKIGPVIFEIAKSEIGYTQQRPQEYAVVVLAAALASGYKGPVFIQGDHFQLNSDNFKADPGQEVSSIESLVTEAIKAKFLQIDIDASTLVDLSKGSLADQQRDNFEATAHLTKVIRRQQPEDTTIAIGGEIGHIGGKNSTTEEFSAFMDGYTKLVGDKGISKVSVQTGSSHGGVPLPDGTIKKVSLDFSVLSQIGGIARSDYKLAGAVQHGASTLPLDLFGKFPKNNTVEIHLATGFQNTLYDHLPKGLLDEIYIWIERNLKSERDKDQTRDQFLYKSRKKALGPFKKQLWSLSEGEKQPVLTALNNQFEKIFTKLNIYNTESVLSDYVR